MATIYGYLYDDKGVFVEQVPIYGVFDEEGNESHPLPPKVTLIDPPPMNTFPYFDEDKQLWVPTVVPDPLPEQKPDAPIFNAEEEIRKLREEYLKEIKSLKEEVSQWKRINSDLSSSLQRTRYYLTLALPGASHLFRD